MKHIVYIGIGSNLGDRHSNCVRAIEKIRWKEGIEVVAVSNWHETEALTIGNEKQPRYINGAVKILTGFTPRELLKMLKNVEEDIGREFNRPKWSARTIDLDILFYDDLVISEGDLKIPHPEIKKRIFVLKPLCDIEPRLIHPVLKKSVKELYDVIANEVKQSHEGPEIAKRSEQ